MPRYKLTIAYDGTDFCGWQKQMPFEDAVPTAPKMEAVRDDGAPAATTAEEELASGEDAARARVELRTVQGVVERAVRAVVREPVILVGASRTDSGVHARGQVAAFTCSDLGSREGGWPLERGTEALLRAINSRLPPDVLVLGAEVAPEEFDPIKGAASKAYSYTIWNSQTRPLWERKTALHIWSSLDVARMDEAARVFEGEHDFAAFAAAGHGRLSTVRTVFSCRVREGACDQMDARRIVIEINGSGFLWNMVRIIGGTLVEVGKAGHDGSPRMTTDRIRDALKSGKRDLAGPTLPPQGLCLESIKYA